MPLSSIELLKFADRLLVAECVKRGHLAQPTCPAWVCFLCSIAHDFGTAGAKFLGLLPRIRAPCRLSPRQVFFDDTSPHPEELAGVQLSCLGDAAKARP